MAKQICIILLAAMTALAFILGITPPGGGEATGAPDGSAAPAGVHTAEAAPDDLTLPAETSAVRGSPVATAGGEQPAVLPLTEKKSYSIPADASVTELYINGRQMPHGFAAVRGGVIYLPLEDFCRQFIGVSVSGGGADGNIRLSAEPGEAYIVSGGRCIPCSYDSLDVTVLDWDGCVRIPLTAAASAAGMEIVRGADGSVSLTGVPHFPDADEVYNDDDLYWLSRIISAESRGEPFEGQVAVGCVVLNRVRSTRYPDTVYEVVFDNRFGIQFSPAYSGSVYREPAAVSVIAAKLCLEGLSVSDSILFFFNSSIAAGTWITSNRTYTMTVGGHDFYS